MSDSHTEGELYYREMILNEEKRKMLAGELYNARDPEIVADLIRARELTREYNLTRPGDNREDILKKLFGKIGSGVIIEPPFHCDMGQYTYLGDRVFMNFGCVILDTNIVKIGDDTMFGPYVQIYAAHHPIEAEERIKGPEYGTPVTIGKNVWIGGGSIVLPGVTIGDNTTIGAGSVVTKDIPDGVVAAGNPCRVMRKL